MKRRPDEDILRANLYEEQRAASQDYFGDTIRYLFIAAATIMLLTLPFFHRHVPLHFIFSILGVLLIIVCAGLTNARWHWTLLLDCIVSGVALFIFEAYAIVLFRNPLKSTFLLFINQLLAFLFMFALYFSVQTLRRWTTYR